MTGAGVSGEVGLATALLPVLERWKDLGSVAHLVPSMGGNIARGEMLRFSRVHVLVRSKVGTGLCSALSLLLIVSVSSLLYILQRTEIKFSIINIFCIGLIIAAGISSSVVVKSVEVFVPSTGQHCSLPDLSARRYAHTMEGMMLCGGAEIDRPHCLALTGTGWETTTTLLNKR